MITIQTQSDGVLFNFQDSTRYLYGDGSILTPYNSLTLIADESNVLTFRKSASNDIFITAGYDELGYSSKEEAINDLKTKLFKATGGGSESGITSGDVQTMIDNSLEDYYDKDEVDAGFDEVDAALSGKADASDVTEEISAAVSGKADTSAVTAVENDVLVLQDALAGKANTAALTAHTADTVIHVSQQEKNAWNAKAEPYSAGTGIDITNNVISATGGGVTVDPTLDSGSTNPVANSAITTAIDGKQDALEFYSEAETEDSETGEIDKYGQIEVADELNGAHIYADYLSTNEEKSPYASIDAWVNDGEGNEKQNRVYAEADGVQIWADENTDDGEGNIVYRATNVSVTSTEIGMSVSEDVGNTTTTLSITSTGVTINDDAVATEPYVDAATSGKVDTSAITTAITSGSTDDEIPTAKATYDAITAATTGGGATYSAGYGINIDTANTISFNMPITCTTNTNNNITIGNGTNNGSWSLLVGNDMSITNSNAAIGLCVSDMSVGGSSISGNTRGVLIGCQNKIKGGNISVGGGVVIGDRNESTDGGIAIGTASKASGSSTVAIGLSANATGTTKMNLNNQIKVDTNNQIYIKDKTNTTEICLQDALSGGGGSVTVDSGLDINSSNPVENQAITQAFEDMNTFIDTKADQSELYELLGGSNDEMNPVTPIRLLRISQSDYDDLANGDGYDPDTLYIITPDEE